MNNKAGAAAPQINEVAPAEVAGRDTIARFQAQFRAASYACLEILGGKTIDRVYCDYQDDFVCRDPASGAPIYHFCQVKTKDKKNHLWNKPEIFGIPKKQKPKIEKIASSFAGKLMLHTVRFKTACASVVFLTNIQIDDELEGVVTALKKGDFANGVLKCYLERFNEAFTRGEPLDEDTIRGNISKLLLRPAVSYLHPDDADFCALAREAIFKYSEIDLEHTESEGIISNLVSLVQKKSFTKLISDMTPEEFDSAVGIGVPDLLEILSISKGAYRELIAGGDANAIRSASIIQRKLSQAGAPEHIIEFCSKSKVSWDIWLRSKRHTIPEFELNVLLDDLNGIKNQWAVGATKFADLDKPIDDLWNKIDAKNMTATLSKELLLGGVFSALVRSEAQ